MFATFCVFLLVRVAVASPVPDLFKRDAGAEESVCPSEVTEAPGVLLDQLDPDIQWSKSVEIAIMLTMIASIF